LQRLANKVEVKMTKKWATEEVIAVVRGFQPACVFFGGKVGGE